MRRSDLLHIAAEAIGFVILLSVIMAALVIAAAVLSPHALADDVNVTVGHSTENYSPSRISCDIWDKACVDSVITRNMEATLRHDLYNYVMFCVPEADSLWSQERCDEKRAFLVKYGVPLPE